MNPLLAPEYDKWRSHIDGLRNKNISWDDVKMASKRSESELSEWLTLVPDMMGWPSLGNDGESRLARWYEIVQAKREWEENARRNERLPVVVGLEESEQEISVPIDQKSCWQLYKRHLSGNNWKESDIESIEISSLKIVQRLRLSTTNPVKGMVVGYVQSGKTASMAGLMSMAADWGWNLVIVLTGTIENLRKQTESRIFSDLNHVGNLVWSKIPYPSAKSSTGDRAQDCQWVNARQRYLVVSLKNKTRLENLIAWLKRDTNSLKQMRILIIDDEADQASIDTSAAEKEERSVINNLIVKLTQVKAKCVNYVAYTATPYANFLNEAYPDSLYPQNFIVSLPQSNEHFGPEQIFGIRGTDSEGGMGVVNEILPEEIESIKLLHDDSHVIPPRSLLDAVYWFLCAAAAMRSNESSPKPISMLVHTSPRQKHHLNTSKAIGRILLSRDGSWNHLLAECRRVWVEQTENLTLEKFREVLPNYGRIQELIDYPTFDEIAPRILEIVEHVTHIQMEERDGGLQPEYHTGIHLCIDNSSHTGLNDEQEHVRLLYPSRKKLTELGFSPAFIVVGGSTLARGLTIENLVSTYFLRGGAQIDTLMQMGRWFGYRKGYELLPRIWMPVDTLSKFQFMAEVESDLREDLRRFMDMGVDPSQFGPRVKTHPKASWLKPTAKNRMKEAIGDKYDYTGVSRQTTLFHDGPGAKEILEFNIQHTERFLESLGGARNSPIDGTIVWRGVSFELIKGFLASYNYHPRLSFFATEMSAFLKWFDDKKQHYTDWNVVLAGPAGETDSNWVVAGQSIGKINRTRLDKANSDDALSIGTLRDPRHLVADATEYRKLPPNAKNSVIAFERSEVGLGRTPQLLLYRIDGDSKVRRLSDGALASSTRQDLKAKADLIGVSFWMPDAFDKDRRTGFETHLTVRIPPELASQNDDAIDVEEV